MIADVTSLDSNPAGNLPLHSEVPFKHVRYCEVGFEDVNGVAAAVVGKYGPLGHRKLVRRSGESRKRGGIKDSCRDAVRHDGEQTVVAGGRGRKKCKSVLSEIRGKASADRGLPIFEGIPCKTGERRKVCVLAVIQRLAIVGPREVKQDI